MQIHRSKVNLSKSFELFDRIDLGYVMNVCELYERIAVRTRQGYICFIMFSSLRHLWRGALTAAEDASRYFAIHLKYVYRALVRVYRLGALIKVAIAFTQTSFNESEIMLKGELTQSILY